MKTRCLLVKLKPNSKDRVQEWATTLKQRENEVLITLREEGVGLESVFLTTLGASDYLVYIMQSSDFEKAKKQAKDSIHPIDAYHKKFKLDTWLERVELENLVDFQAE